MFSNHSMIRGASEGIVEYTVAPVRQLNSSAVPIVSWVLVGVLAVVLAFALVACLTFTSRMPSDVGTHICRCGGCGRRFRVPSSIPASSFMCRNCIREGRRRMSVVQEEEREERLDEMNSAPKRVMTLHRVSSHFYRMKTRVFGSSGSTDDDDDSEQGDIETGDQTQQPVINIHRGYTRAVDDGQMQIPEDNLCQICFDAEARVVLLPCGHGGLCEGCAKDIIATTGNCFLCRQPVKLVAIVGREEPPVKRTASTASRLERGASSMSTDNYFAQVVGPDQLHHLESRPTDDQLEQMPAVAQPPPHLDAPQLGTPAVTQSQTLQPIREDTATTAATTLPNGSGNDATGRTGEPQAEQSSSDEEVAVIPPTSDNLPEAI